MKDQRSAAIVLGALCAIGVALSIADDVMPTALACGIVALGCAAYVLLKKTEFAVLLHTAGLQRAALTTTDKTVAHAVLAALNEAIVRRS